MREEEERKVKKGSQLFQMAADANFGLRTTFSFFFFFLAIPKPCGNSQAGKRTQAAIVTCATAAGMPHP